MKKTLSKGAIAGIIAGAIVFVALVVVIVVLLATRNSGTGNNNGQYAPYESANREVVVSKDNAKDVANEIKKEEEYLPPAEYEVSMNSKWIFPDGKSPSSNAYVENSTSNTTAVYFDVFLADTEEVIYKSPILPVGTSISDITLSKALSAGTYKCIIKYMLIDDTGRDLSSVQLYVDVVVEK